MCQNEGVCIDGRCQCPEGYIGINCGLQETPDKIVITKLEILRFPGRKENGFGWDAIFKPDIYPEIYLDNKLQLSATEFYEDADSAATYVFEFGSDAALADPWAEYTLVLFDYDYLDQNDDVMGEVNFIPYSASNSFPEEIEIENNKLAFKLYVSYSW